MKHSSSVGDIFFLPLVSSLLVQESSINTTFQFSLKVNVYVTIFCNENSLACDLLKKRVEASFNFMLITFC